MAGTPLLEAVMVKELAATGYMDHIWLAREYSQ